MNDFYAKTDYPSQFLVDHVTLLPKGRVLDVAMGGGRNSIYLVRMGFDVEGVDISQDAINKALGNAMAQGVQINASVVDLEGDYKIKKGGYDVIVCFNYLQRNLISSIKAGIRPGGMIVYETYTVDQPRFGRPTNPHYLLKPNELLDMFRDFRCLRYHEGVFENRKAVAGIIAEKL